MTGHFAQKSMNSSPVTTFWPLEYSVKCRHLLNRRPCDAAQLVAPQSTEDLTLLFLPILLSSVQGRLAIFTRGLLEVHGYNIFYLKAMHTFQNFLMTTNLSFYRINSIYLCERKPGSDPPSVDSLFKYLLQLWLGQSRLAGVRNST